jgi:hypothetical protein
LIGHDYKPSSTRRTRPWTQLSSAYSRSLCGVPTNGQALCDDVQQLLREGGGTEVVADGDPCRFTGEIGHHRIFARASVETSDVYIDVY